MRAPDRRPSRRAASRRTTAAGGVNYDWWQEFTRAGDRLGTTVHAVGHRLRRRRSTTVARFVDGQRATVPVVGRRVLYLVMLHLSSGGIIDRYARDRRTRAHGFFAASGCLSVRFLRLGIIAAVVYGLLFGVLHPWLFDALYPRLTRDLTSNAPPFFARARAVRASSASPLAAVNLVFDYAKVRLVVEDRRSMLGALGGAARLFVRRNLRGAVPGLYCAERRSPSLPCWSAYALVAPGVGQPGWSMWLAFAIGQLYVLARLSVKLLFWASETALFQGRLRRMRRYGGASRRRGLSRWR